MNPINYLVFSGGGPAVYGYAGAILQLNKQANFSFDDIKGIAGSSVGTIAALLVALNYSPERIVELIKAIDLKKFADGDGLTSRTYRLFKEYGMYKGDALYQFILQILQEKTGRSDPENITFADLKKAGYKDLYVVTTKIYKENNRPTAKQKLFSAEKTPFTSVAAAILASCSAPVYFRRVRLERKAKGTYVLSDQGDVFEDGGIVNNYPINLFDQPQFIPFEELKSMKQIINPHTLGFSLLNNYEINDDDHPVTKSILTDYYPFSYAEGLWRGITLPLHKQNLEKRANRNRTVQIDRLNVGLADFHIDDSTKNALVSSGEKAVKHYFEMIKRSELILTASNDSLFSTNVKNVSDDNTEIEKKLAVNIL